MSSYGDMMNGSLHIPIKFSVSLITMNIAQAGSTIEQFIYLATLFCEGE